MHYSTKIAAGTLLILSALLVACGGGDPNAGKKVYDFERADSLSSTYLKELGSVQVSIKETAKLNEALRDNGYSFNSGSLLSPSRASSFSGNKAQALALGAYGSDLNYATSFNQTQEARNYLDAIVTLSNSLGVASAFDQELITQIVEGDSTTNRSRLLAKAYVNAEDQLYSNDRAKLATMMVAGGWIEGMYIGAEAIKAKKPTQDVAMGIWSHAFTLENVENMLKVWEGDADCESLLEELKAVKGPVNSLVKTQGSPNKMNDGLIEKLHTSISGVRKKVIG